MLKMEAKFKYTIVLTKVQTTLASLFQKKLRKNLRKSEAQFREKLRKLRLRQNSDFRIKKKRVLLLSKCTTSFSLL